METIGMRATWIESKLTLFYDKSTNELSLRLDNEGCCQQRLFQQLRYIFTLPPQCSIRAMRGAKRRALMVVGSGSQRQEQRRLRGSRF